MEDELELQLLFEGNPSYFDEEESTLYKRARRSESIGIIKQEKERVASLANIMLLIGLKRSAPVYTGNLSINGIKSQKNSSTSYDIVILAPGSIDYQGKKLPDYGWQTDMLDRLMFYTVDGEFINVSNKNKGWVEESVYDTLGDFLKKENGGLL